MTLQSSGAISLHDIQTEFGGTNPIILGEYYGVANGIPTSGAIDVSDFYGASVGATASLKPADDTITSSTYSDRIGFGVDDKNDFYYPEARSLDYSAPFGSLTNRTSLITSATVNQFQSEYYYGSSIYNGYIFSIGVSGITVSGGFTTVSINGYLPSASATVNRSLTRASSSFGEQSAISSGYIFYWRKGLLAGANYSPSNAQTIEDFHKIIEYASDNSREVMITFT